MSCKLYVIVCLRLFLQAVSEANQTSIHYHPQQNHMQLWGGSLLLLKQTGAENSVTSTHFSDFQGTCKVPVAKTCFTTSSHAWPLVGDSPAEYRMVSPCNKFADTSCCLHSEGCHGKKPQTVQSSRKYRSWLATTLQMRSYMFNMNYSSSSILLSVDGVALPKALEHMLIRNQWWNTDCIKNQHSQDQDSRLFTLWNVGDRSDNSPTVAAAKRATMGTARGKEATFWQTFTGNLPAHACPPYVRKARQIKDAPNANPRGNSGCSQCSHANLAHHLFSTLLTGTPWISWMMKGCTPIIHLWLLLILFRFTFFLLLSLEFLWQLCCQLMYLVTLLAWAHTHMITHASKGSL